MVSSEQVFSEVINYVQNSNLNITKNNLEIDILKKKLNDFKNDEIRIMNIKSDLKEKDKVIHNLEKKLRNVEDTLKEQRLKLGMKRLKLRKTIRRPEKSLITK